MTSTLWDTERQLIHTQNEINDKNNEIAYLKDCLKHRDDEIEDLYHILEASQNLDKLSQLQDENLKLLKQCQDIEQKYTELNTSLMHLYDIEFTM